VEKYIYIKCNIWGVASGTPVLYKGRTVLKA